jgi:hypothetical protein
VHALLGHQERLADGPKYFDRIILQSGTFGVMGFWDRERIDEIWRGAVDDMDLEDASNEEVLEKMRDIPWQRFVHAPALQVSLGMVQMRG